MIGGGLGRVPKLKSLAERVPDLGAEKEITQETEGGRGESKNQKNKRLTERKGPARGEGVNAYAGRWVQQGRQGNTVKKSYQGEKTCRPRGTKSRLGERKKDLLREGVGTGKGGRFGALSSAGNAGE